MVSQKFITNAGYVEQSIIMLQNQFTLLHRRDCNGLLNCPLSQLSVSLLYTMRNASSDHNRPASKSQTPAKRSSWCRLTRRRLSGWKKDKRDTSVKRNRFRYLNGNLGACAVNQAIRCMQRGWVRGGQTYSRRSRILASRSPFPIIPGWYGKCSFDGS